MTISIVLSLLGVQPYLSASGIDYEQLLIFCLVWGMAGSFISLALSRIMAKMMMGVKVIDPNSAGEFGSLVQTVHKLARQANLPKMPEVGVYMSPEVNAFATGPTKSRALVAVSSGLLQSMKSNELEGVLGHEIAHIQNGDMVTMTLLQGVVNALVMFVARVVAFFATQGVKEESRYLVRSLVTIVFELVFAALGMLIVTKFSRYREFRADAGSAKLSGKANMIAALQALARMQGIPAPANQPASMETYKITAGHTSGWKAAIMSHPPLEARIQALQSAAI
jgi:heat shock protein HtpX